MRVFLNFIILRMGSPQAPPPSFPEIKFYFKNIKFYNANQCIPRHTHTHNRLTAFVRDNPSRPVPEETLIHSHPTWSSDILYHLPTFTTIHGILFVHFTCLTILSDNLFPGPLWSLCIPRRQKINTEVNEVTFEEYWYALEYKASLISLSTNFLPPSLKYLKQFLVTYFTVTNNPYQGMKFLTSWDQNSSRAGNVTALSVLIRPCSPALLKLYSCKCTYCCIIGQIKWWWWWWYRCEKSRFINRLP